MKALFLASLLVLAASSASAEMKLINGKFRVAQSGCGPACTGDDIAICKAYKIKAPTQCCPMGCSVP